MLLFLSVVLIACDKTPKAEVSFASEEETIEVEETLELEPILSDDKLELGWTSSNPEVATVDNDGLVTGLKKGETIIKVIVKDQKEEVSATIKIIVVDKPIPNPTSVIIEGANSEVKVGEKLTLTAKVLPAAAPQTVTWSSSNQDIAKVSETGVVDFKAIGEVTITAKSTADPTKLKEVKIIVNAPDPESVTVTAADNKTTVIIYETLQFSALVSPDIANQGVTWTTSNTQIATISETGLLTAIAVGQVKVKATSKVLETVFAEIEITIVQPNPESISVTGNVNRIVIDETVQLKSVVEPVAALQDVTYTSSNPAIATVSETGLVTGVAKGEVTITVKSVADATITATFKITVFDEAEIDINYENVLLDENLEAARFETITVDGVDYVVGYTAFKNAKDAFAALQEGSKLVVKAGSYSDPVAIKYNNITIEGPNKGIKADKGLEDRVEEAIFNAIITLDGVEGIVIDGIKLSGRAQIRSTKPLNDITILNIHAYDVSAPASEGIIYFEVQAGQVNENIIISNSNLDDNKLASYRGIRINNAKNLTITNNYFHKFYDVIRLEGEGAAGAGVGTGVTGELIIEGNTFEMNIQYLIWIGAWSAEKVEINNNHFGVDPNASGTYGFVYFNHYKAQEGLKTVANITNNFAPYNTAWHEYRFNTNGATSEQLEINVNFNVFSEKPAPNGEVSCFHIADHFANSTFTINGKNNIFLYDGDVEESFFLNTDFSQYTRELADKPN